LFLFGISILSVPLSFSHSACFSEISAAMETVLLSDEEVRDLTVTLHRHNQLLPSDRRSLSNQLCSFLWLLDSDN
jgi:hypothetical protein